MGDGTETNKYTTVKVLRGVQYVAAGSSCTFAIKNDGSLWGWGMNTFGQLGIGENYCESKPYKVMNNVALFKSFLEIAMAVKNDGTLYAWGWNTAKMIDNAGEINTNVPTKITTDVADIALTSSGYYILKKINHYGI